jgi:hypothetical protein
MSSSKAKIVDLFAEAKSNEHEGKVNQRISGNGNIQAGNNVILNPKPIVEGPYVIACPNCSNSVSSAAPVCPNCGHPVADHIRTQKIKEAEKRIVNFLFIVGVIVLGLFELEKIMPDFVTKYISFGIGGAILIILFLLGTLDSLKKL